MTSSSDSFLFSACTDNCFLCLNIVRRGVFLPCCVKKTVHTNCFFNWYNGYKYVQTKSCPFCRADITQSVKEIVNGTLVLNLFPNEDSRLRIEIETKLQKEADENIITSFDTEWPTAQTNHRAIRKRMRRFNKLPDLFASNSSSSSSSSSSSCSFTMTNGYEFFDLSGDGDEEKVTNDCGSMDTRCEFVDLTVDDEEEVNGGKKRPRNN